MRTPLRCVSFVGVLTGLLLPAGSPATPVAAGQPAAWRTLAGEPRDARDTEALLRRLVEQHGADALSVAVVDGGQAVFARTVGTIDRAHRRAADERTVFRAASLSKPVFAYLVMRLVDQGRLDLDTPVHRYLEKPLYTYPAYASFRDDTRYERLTTRLLLSHQGGLPNWRNERPNGPLPFGSDPGARFAYSGEGYGLLQFVVEQITAKALAALAAEEVFAPLGMQDSSYLWEPRFDGRFAIDLDTPLAGLVARTRVQAVAAASLITNAADYAKFLAAVANGVGLSERARRTLREPQVALTSRSLFSEPGTDDGGNRAHQLAWTTGWGTFVDGNGRALFHVGMEEGCENFSEVFLGRKLAVAVFSMTARPGPLSRPIVDHVIGPAFSPLTWLEYDRPPAWPRAAVLGPALAGLLAAALAWRLVRRRGR